MKRSPQAGVALVTILLIVAVATVMATTIIQEQRSAIQSARGQFSRGQAHQYALGGEELARQILAEDLQIERERDHLAETWASDELHFEFEEGEVHLQITDLQGLINVNNLSGAYEVKSRQWLINLLSAHALDPGYADRIQDWIDADTSSRSAGAEDFEYLAQEPPYRAGNTQLVHVSELLLTGMPPEGLLLLSEALTALPQDTSRLNVNTAPAAVIQALSPSLSYDVADSLTRMRDEQEGYQTVNEFLQLPELAGLGIDADGLGVQSIFFEVRVIARYQDRFSYLTSVVQRNAVDGTMRVILRDFSRTFNRSRNRDQ